MGSTLSRWVKRALAASAIVVLAVVGFSGACYYRITRSALPQTAGIVSMSGLSAEVRVLRDRWGIPHIYAANADDLFLAQGFVTAQDRLWQMDMLRRSACGELSEVVGERAFQYDRVQRRLGYRGVSEKAIESLPPEIKNALDRYAAGVNQFIASHASTLPFEFKVLNYEPRPWTPVDSIVIGKLMAQTLGTTWQQDLMRESFREGLDADLYSDLFIERSPYDVPFVGSDESVAPSSEAPAPPAPKSKRDSQPSSTPPDLDLFLSLLDPPADDAPRGSNNWVVAGSRTASGKPILANDPHLELAIPPIWHAVQVRTSDGRLDAAGVTFPGAPGVVIGHNSRIGWGVTNFNPDVQDLYAEVFDEQGLKYLVGDQWQAVEVRDETIRVRKDSLGREHEDRVERVMLTRHGPIVSDRGSIKYSLRWTALDPAAEITAFARVVRAHDWTSFCEALGTYPGPMQNFVYADVDGNIGYYAAGNVPIRRTGTGEVPYEGASDDGDWTGFVPFAELPHVLNPETGYVVTANNRVVGTDTPRFFTHEWIAPFRARRIGELIAAREKHTPATIAEIQADVFSYPHSIFAREALELAEGRVVAGDARAEWRELVELLKPFDGHLRSESVPAAVVTAMRKDFNDRVLRGRLGTSIARYRWFSRESLLAMIVEERPPEWLPHGVESWDELLLTSYRAAVADLSKRLGSDRTDWKYGRINRFAFAHPLGSVAGLGSVLNADEIEMSGGSHTVKAFMGDQPKKWGSSIRLIIDFSDFDRTTLNLTTGESGHHASDHYVDQVADWASVQPHEFPFSDEAVLAATDETLIFRP